MGVFPGEEPGERMIFEGAVGVGQRQSLEVLRGRRRRQLGPPLLDEVAQAGQLGRRDLLRGDVVAVGVDRRGRRRGGNKARQHCPRGDAHDCRAHRLRTGASEGNLVRHEITCRASKNTPRRDVATVPILARAVHCRLSKDAKQVGTRRRGPIMRLRRMLSTPSRQRPTAISPGSSAATIGESGILDSDLRGDSLSFSNIGATARVLEANSADYPVCDDRRRCHRAAPARIRAIMTDAGSGTCG